jgi:hypothetical protein
MMREQITKLTDLLQHRTEEMNRIVEDRTRTFEELAISQCKSNDLELRLRGREEEYI